MTYGTSYFVSRKAAIRYYRAYEGSDAPAAVARKIREGEIHIGKPSLKPGERLSVIDGRTRYAISNPAKRAAGRPKKNPTRVKATMAGKRKMKSGAKKLAAWVRGQIKKNPRVKTRVVRKNSTTIKGYKSVTIKKLPDGRVQVTGRK